MGASASTNISTKDASIISDTVATCPAVTANNQLIIKKLDAGCPDWCGPGNCHLNIGQQASVSGECVINSVIDQASEALAKMGADSEAGFGIAASTNASTIKTDLKSKLDAACGDVSAQNKIEAEDIKTRVCDAKILQFADAKSKCQLDLIQKAIDKSTIDLKSGAKGATLASMLGFGSLGILIIAGIGIGGYYAYQSSQDQEGGDSIFDTPVFSLPDSTTSWTLWIIVGLCLVVLIMWFNKPNAPQIIPVQPRRSNIKHINQKYDDIGPSQQLINDYSMPYHTSLNNYYETLL